MVGFTCSASAAWDSLVPIRGADLYSAHQAMLWQASLVLVEEIIHLLCLAVNICWFMSDIPPFSILNE